jgi:hypothetical protein
MSYSQYKKISVVALKLATYQPPKENSHTRGEYTFNLSKASFHSARRSTRQQQCFSTNPVKSQHQNNMPQEWHTAQSSWISHYHQQTNAFQQYLATSQSTATPNTCCATRTLASKTNRQLSSTRIMNQWTIPKHLVLSFPSETQWGNTEATTPTNTIRCLGVLPFRCLLASRIGSTAHAQHYHLMQYSLSYLLSNECQQTDSFSRACTLLKALQHALQLNWELHVRTCFPTPSCIFSGFLW